MTRFEYQRQEIPDPLLVCELEPMVPAQRTDENVANYVTDLAYAGRDCRAKLDAVRGIVIRPGDQNPPTK